MESILADGVQELPERVRSQRQDVLNLVEIFRSRPDTSCFRFAMLTLECAQAWGHDLSDRLGSSPHQAESVSASVKLADAVVKLCCKEHQMWSRVRSLSHDRELVVERCCSSLLQFADLRLPNDNVQWWCHVFELWCEFAVVAPVVCVEKLLKRSAEFLGEFNDSLHKFEESKRQIAKDTYVSILFRLWKQAPEEVGYMKEVAEALYALEVPDNKQAELETFLERLENRDAGVVYAAETRKREFAVRLDNELTLLDQVLASETRCPMLSREQVQRSGGNPRERKGKSKEVRKCLLQHLQSRTNKTCAELVWRVHHVLFVFQNVNSHEHSLCLQTGGLCARRRHGRHRPDCEVHAERIDVVAAAASAQRRL
jgi:hypothetical protein